ncbi:unnamed protein product [Meganyctiphanes norvegica]|uniref:ShKT domain-containing protein n=1 Tax=Meganyctiphanes norvegica TaxID=48144 RepID=A0AAV2S4J9_MEGNR
MRNAAMFWELLLVSLVVAAALQDETENIETDALYKISEDRIVFDYWNSTAEQTIRDDASIGGNNETNEELSLENRAKCYDIDSRRCRNKDCDSYIISNVLCRVTCGTCGSRRREFGFRAGDSTSGGNNETNAEPSLENRGNIHRLSFTISCL